MADRALTRSEIRRVKERVEDELLGRPGVRGVDINVKTVNGEPTGQLSIVVYVEEKKPKARVAKEEMIPAEIDGIPTDVQEEKIELHQLTAMLRVETQVDASKYTTLKGGISMGPCRSVHLEPPEVPTAGDYVFVGTLGAIVKDRGTGAAMALTNFHVACVDSGWHAGDQQCQPGRVDGGSCPSDVFGSLTRATLSDNVDGAVVTLNGGVAYDCSIEGIGGVKGTAAAVVGSTVRKRGRTTELTTGKVDSTDVSLTIDYGDGIGNHTLKHQIRIKPDTSVNPKFSDHGDSGSVVVDANNKVVGLLFGGSATATYINPIQKVLDELNVDLCVKPSIVLTKPVICEPIKTKAVVCLITKPITCPIVTKPVICAVVTSPVHCPVKTLAACPPVTLACPVATLACGTQPPIGELPGVTPRDAYGRTDAEAVDDAFWLGYYTALERLSESEEAQGD